MANRYWVGGTDSWNGTAGSKWATTSGGAGGAAVPTTADDVFLDANSGSGTVTIASGNTGCRSFDSTGFTGTIAGSAAISVGDGTAGASNNAWVWGAGIARTYTGAITLQSTSATQQNITCNGKSFGAGITINCASNGSYKLTDTFNSSTISFTLTKGSFTTNGQAFTIGAFSSTNSNVRSLTIDNSTVTIAAVSNSWNTSTTTNLTFSAMNSSVVLNGGSSLTAFHGGGLSFNNVTINTNGALTAAITGSNSYASLTINGAANKSAAVTIAGTQTISSSLTLAGNSATNRLLISSEAVGTARTISAGMAPTVSNADFRDITGSGAGSWNLSAATGGSGDAGGNSGITFTTAAAQTWNGTSGGNWSANAWTTRVPLPQDDVTINAAFIASQTITVDMPRMGKSIDFTGISGSPTLTSSGTNELFGGLTLASGLGTSTNFTPTFAGRGSFVFTSVGKALGNINISGRNGTITHGDAYSSATKAIYINQNNTTWNTGGYSITAATVAFISGGGGTSTGTITNSTLHVTNWNGASTNFTLNASGSTISFIDGTTSFSPGNPSGNYGTIAIVPSASVHTFAAAGGFASFTAVAITRSGTGTRTVEFAVNGTYTLTGGASAFISGTAGNLYTIRSTGAGSAFTVASATTLVTDYISLKDCTGAGAGIPHDAGANSTNVSGNTNWNFGAPVQLPYVVGGGVCISGGVG